ncbi:molybdopterin-dependent oxidoreductase [uncultured Cohaesibacter sp.]|uniref:molybdopterin-dependent oxidoreductase n=1 Tax=uncultured Cohaesibacter sp. TaxID=1002546 RepID=UPI0029C6CFC9|nr:molybdopterin-dependent oxidoreductase [uncultured Cohaesibacter sp.]
MQNRSAKEDEIRTTCPYCGVGCGVIVRNKADDGIEVRGDPDHPANFGRLCSKGSALAETIGLDGRLLTPKINGETSSWDDALDLVAEKFSTAIAEHGPESVAIYAAGQILTEDYYVVNKWMKGFVGAGNIDTNSRLCMASSVAGHRRAFGSDTVPGIYEDLEEADLITLVGSNLAWCHPVLYQRIAAAKEKRPEMKIVLVDPRRTMTADICDLHLPIAPNGDVALFNGLLAHLARYEALDKDYIETHTNGFEEALAKAADAASLGKLEELTGLPSPLLEDYYDLFLKTEKAVTIYSQGVNQSAIGTDKVNAIINCHLATGRIGKEGMGPFSVTGQPNAMGGREVGGLANLLASHMEINNPAHRDLVKRFWKAPNLAERPGLKAVDLFEAVRVGKIKALWIMSTNPVVSMPQADRVAEALSVCPFVVVSEVQTKTDTSAYGHVLLPAADWGEKDGTVTNSERRISRQRPFRAPSGDARPDWWQVAEVARRMGFGEAFSYQSSAEIFAEYAALSAFENNGERDFDIGALSGICDDDYDRLEPFQWPYRAGDEPGETRFFANGGFYTPDRRGRFIAVDSVAPRATSAKTPLLLNTGRLRDQWHTMTRTGKSPRLAQHIAEPFLEINPEDALALGVRDADIVRVESDHGAVLLRALITLRVQKGQVFAPFHWNDQFASNGRVDTLIRAVTDPHSGQPASKLTAVSVAPVRMAQYGFAVLRHRPEVIPADYWAIARIPEGWQVEMAFKDVCEETDDLVKDLLGAGTAVSLLDYRDRQSGQIRVAAFEGGALHGAFFMAPKPVGVSRSWAAHLLRALYDEPLRRHMVVAGRAGMDQPDIGAIVCSCYSVGHKQIEAAVIEKGCDTVQAVGKCLKAGSNCGSCKAEIQQIIDHTAREAAE